MRTLTEQLGSENDRETVASHSDNTGVLKRACGSLAPCIMRACPESSSWLELVLSSSLPWERASLNDIAVREVPSRLPLEDCPCPFASSSCGGRFGTLLFPTRALILLAILPSPPCARCNCVCDRRHLQSRCCGEATIRQPGSFPLT